jgi:DNA-binding transcriptional regulator PaaX
MDKKDEKQNYKAHQLKNIVMSALGISLVLGGSILITPNFPIVLSVLIKIIEELKGQKIPKPKVRRVLKRLEKRRLISLEGRGDQVQVKVLENGRIKLLKYSIKSLLEVKMNKKWDGKWFIVVFDVPEVERNKRNFLRKFLNEIGFFLYKQIVYVFPYECEEEIKLVKRIVEGGNYISYFEAGRLEREEEVKEFFMLD